MKREKPDNVKTEAMLTGIVESVVKTRDYTGNCYRGRIDVYDNGRKTWHEVSTIVRVFRCDAMNDAKALAESAQAPF
jgi:hypothetical protein